MRQIRVAIGCGVLVSVLFTAPSQSHAQFGSLQRLVFSQVSQALSPASLSSPQNGPLYQFNSFDQRLEMNRLGDGFNYEFYRLFGPDSFGNPNTVDLGPLKVELGLDPNLIGGQPVGLHQKVGFTTAFIPELTMQSQTGQRSFNQFTGISNFAPAPVHYNATLNTGIQDFQFDGNLAIDSNSRINALGFYDLKFRVINVGNYSADGAAVKDEQVTDFDTGEINVSGNIALDAISGIFQSTGLGLAGTPSRVGSGAAQKERVDDLLAKLDAGEHLSDEDASFLAEQMFITAFMNDPLGVLFNGMPTQVPGFENLCLQTDDQSNDPAAGDPIPDPGNPPHAPEPTMLVIVGFASLVFGSARSYMRNGRRGPQAA